MAAQRKYYPDEPVQSYYPEYETPVVSEPVEVEEYVFKPRFVSDADEALFIIQRRELRKFDPVRNWERFAGYFEDACLILAYEGDKWSIRTLRPQITRIEEILKGLRFARKAAKQDMNESPHPQLFTIE